MSTAQLAISVVGGLIAIALFSYCEIENRKLHHAAEIEHIKQGHCRSWSGWEKCTEATP